MQNREEKVPHWIKELTDDDLDIVLSNARQMLAEEKAAAQVKKGPNSPRFGNKKLLGIGAAAGIVFGLSGHPPNIDALSPAPVIERVKDNLFEEKEIVIPKSSRDRMQKKPEAAEVKPLVWEPKENTASDDNGVLKIEPSGSNWPGMINFFHKDEKSGEWIQHNNIVPVTRVITPNGEKYSNTEEEKATIKRSVFVDKDGKKKVKYDFPKLENGSHFYIVASFEPGKKEVSMTPYAYPDSALIADIHLGNFLGIEDAVNNIRGGDGKLYHATDYGPVNDGLFKQGLWVGNIPPSGNSIEFWGDKWLQKQRVQGEVVGTVVEVRDFPWAEHQIKQDPQRKWFEAVALKTKPGSTVIFSVEPLPKARTQ